MPCKISHLRARTAKPTLQVYEGGAIFDPKVLDITDDDLLKTVKAGIANITAVSLGASIATIVAVPHLVINGFRNVLAVALETDYSFPLADKVRLPPNVANVVWCSEALFVCKLSSQTETDLAHVAVVGMHLRLHACLISPLAYGPEAS